MVSRKNLLKLERETEFGLPVSKNFVPLALSSQIDTLNVLVLKVEFQRENPDDPTTTGDGTFDLRSYDQFLQEEGHFLDPAPHNTSYFSAHMQALARYWRFVSDRRLRLIWEVYPVEETVALRLPHPMSYYGMGGNPDSIVTGLERFFVHSITLADSLLPQLDFGRFQSVIVFHAGSDQQNNFSFINDTPNDLWTGFIMLGDSVSVDSGRNYVSEGLLMPETACQDNRITCLNAVLAHEFGHQLGLVDIYSTLNFMTQVGDFSLMDNNGMSVAIDLGGGARFVNGALPVYPDAWSRAYLGFSAVHEIVNQQNVPIRAAEQGYFNNEIVKVPISEYEYFLIENRQTEADFGYLDYNPSIPNVLLADPATGVILGPGYAYFDMNDTIKVPTGEYDRLLPGDGILIWHVDEAVAYMDYVGNGRNNFLNNTLQWDPSRRFLTVVEADGIMDFGGNYFTGFGSAGDFYRIDNNAALSPFTNPSSRSNLGADSHIWITNIDSSDTLMYCSIRIDWFRQGFPVMGFPYIGDNSPLIFLDLDADGRNELLTGGGIFLICLKNDGTPYFPLKSGLYVPRFDGDSLIYDLPLFTLNDTSFAAKPVAGNLSGDGELEVVLLDNRGILRIYAPIDNSPLDSMADMMAEMTFPAAVTAPPLTLDFDLDGYDEILVGLEDRTVRYLKMIAPDSLAMTRLDSLTRIPRSMAIADSLAYIICGDDMSYTCRILRRSGLSFSHIIDIELPNGRFGGLAAADFNRDLLADAAVVIGNRLCLIDGATQSHLQRALPNPGPPAAGDIDADGYPDIALIGGDRFLTIYAFNRNGVYLDGFPVRLNVVRDYSSDSPEVTLADLNSTGYPDIIFALPIGGFAAYDHTGTPLPGFPLPTTSRLIGPPAACDLDGDGTLEVAALDSFGFITAWNLEADYDSLNNPWPMASGSHKANPVLGPQYNRPINTPDGFLTEGTVYCYPNPASDRLAFRYYSDRDAVVEVKIFDMSGELVDKLSGVAMAGSDNEIAWDCHNIASGVYLARLEADAADAKKHVILKVALIK